MSYTFEALKLAELARPQGIKGAPETTVPEVKPELAGQTNRPVGAAGSVPARNERRAQKRAAMRIYARFRTAEPRDSSFQEILTTLNASRAGLYFTTDKTHFYVGMRLRVTFPYTSEHDAVSASESTGHVVRIDSLKGERFGVAVALHHGVQVAPAPAPAQVQTVESPKPSPKSRKERRRALRYPFSAGALVIEAHTDARLQARCSDLSLAGCYVDTLNPFPEGTNVLLQLSHRGKGFGTIAQVISSHIGMGMGLSFQELAPEQTSILVGWIGERHSAPQAGSSQELPAVEPRTVVQEHPPTAQNQQNNPGTDPDRELLVTFFRLLESKGLLEKSGKEAKSEIRPEPII